MPRVTSVRRADVANLTLADIDLSLCHFESTLRLDELRLATLCPFDQAPSSRTVFGMVSVPRVFAGASFPPLWRWTKRITIHEERCWRVSTSKRKSWMDKSVERCPEKARLPSDSGTSKRRSEAKQSRREERRSDAQRLAKIYRALRKGREDERNAPGAGDFYYGEMEMRRHGEDSPFERAVIWLYWLVSGYGLRASRALTALGVTVLLFTVLFTIGDIRDGKFDDDLVFSLQSTTSLLRTPAEDLSIEGRLLEIGLRLIGPLFFGLALLSLRGRVKR